MGNLTAEEIAGKLVVPNLGPASPNRQAITDPIADTPMLVTLDQLRPYDHNPRVTRNPRYDEIKASIRERHLDAPPPITRRPGEPHYIIRNGGNTRLAILGELWTETRDEKFFRFFCLFRPWPERGEIIALTGHLCENELRGGLSFIERALGVQKVRELYEIESGKPLTQMELARRLCADGYPVSQSYVSRLQDCVTYLLPAIPRLLYGGLGRHPVERLTTLRRAAERIWQRRARQKSLQIDYLTLFQDVLRTFDGEPEGFSLQRIQDELLGQLSQLFREDYDALTLELVDSEARQRPLAEEPPPAADTRGQRRAGSGSPSGKALDDRRSSDDRAPASQTGTVIASSNAPVPAASASAAAPTPASDDRETDPHSALGRRLEGHIVTPIETTDRLQAIQRTIADATGDTLEDFERNVVRAIPVQAGGLHPISDVWYIEPSIDTSDRLRTHVAQLAREIAQEVGFAQFIESTQDGVGFVCQSVPHEGLVAFMPRALWGLLQALSLSHVTSQREGDLGPLLLGVRPSRKLGQDTRLSDASLVKLFRLIRLARRLIDLETAQAPFDR